MGPWIPQYIALFSTGVLTVKSLEVPASLDVFKIQQSQSTQTGICGLFYLLQSHAVVPKLALGELIEVLKPLSLENRDKFDEGVSFQHRFITKYLFKASLGTSTQHCALNCTHTSASHGNMHIFYIQCCTERLHEFYCFTPKKTHVQAASESETKNVQGKNTSEKV